MITNPLMLRTVAKLVSLEQVCRLRHVDAQALIVALRAAARTRQGLTPQGDQRFFSRQFECVAIGYCAAAAGYRGEIAGLGQLPDDQERRVLEALFSFPVPLCFSFAMTSK